MDGWQVNEGRPTADTTLLVFRAGASDCAIPASDVAETMRPLRIDSLAGTPEYVLGISIVRGRPIPVIDAGFLLGVGGRSAVGRFVVIRAGERVFALGVSAVVGVVSAARHRLHALPPILGEGPSDLVASIGRRDSELLVVLRGARIVPDAVWTAVDARGVNA
jgi:purine-binding chemotaxis protein CheW